MNFSKMKENNQKRKTSRKNTMISYKTLKTILTMRNTIWQSKQRKAKKSDLKKLMETTMILYKVIFLKKMISLSYSTISAISLPKSHLQVH